MPPTTPAEILEHLNSLGRNTLVETLGIKLTETGPGFLKGTMPVDHRTHQPMGLLHGGASAALAETLGSIGAHMAINSQTHYCVGLEINANHIRGVRSGLVTGQARALHLGRTTQVWEIKITDEQDKLVCVSRITMAVIPHGSEAGK